MTGQFHAPAAENKIYTLVSKYGCEHGCL